MSELEKKGIDEMDAAEMLEQHRAKTGGIPAEDFAVCGGSACALRLYNETVQDRERERRELGTELKKLLRTGAAMARREAGDLALLDLAVAGSCAAALISGEWVPIVAVIGAVNLLTAGFWLCRRRGARWDEK